ncbi:MAG: hypothetical protein COV72_02760 [Candidatus Omnitrophica bacterium CG11_big_fil_rev_8_21_14_0_20_42_13]|uniref:PilZ domain-containing protein n=1 Tax=Candidatus Ghiorseimicrobium undicola TaxID=1974746 RepID=A0A2H0LYV9_9BACT|nr:MAG: hypothetical protein COV72_02760 [Candidatus Omnitrophica bacterium CG11_big_fil_rev_8_21_14_0_20_42_13]
MIPIPNKRRFPRFNYSIPVKYQLRNELIPFYTVTRDISVGGLKILTNKFIPPNTDISIEVKLTSERIINAKTKVAWSNRIEHSEQYLSGLKFFEINPDDRQNVSELVSYALKH